MAEEKTNSKHNICGLCNENDSKYCCPRCEVLYCSLNCYKSDKHMECSETFYRECVNQELATYHTDDESKDKMLDILKRMQNEDINVDDFLEDEDVDSDDDDKIDLEERLKDLNLDDADAVWNALTEDERNEFEALLNKGDVGAIVPQWEPWWTSYKEKKLVQDVGAVDKDILKNCPELKTVPELSSITSVKPSPMITYNIINVLASYAFIKRYYNGEIEPLEGMVCLHNICANLDANTNFEEPALAIESVVQKCLQSELITTDEASLDVMKSDIFRLLQGPSADNKKHYCKAALSDLHNLLTKAKTAQKSKVNSPAAENKTSFSRKFPEHTKEHLPSLDSIKVKKSLKKIEYYLSFLESYSMDFE